MNNILFTRQILSPLYQFEIKDLLSIDGPMLSFLHLAITNIGFYLAIGGGLLVFKGAILAFIKHMNTSGWWLNFQSLSISITSIVKNQLNPLIGIRYLPFVLALFIFILINNVIGMLPFSFASTSHFIVTFFLSFSIVLGSTLLGFVLHRVGFFSLLVPAGCPLPLLPLLVLIEFISYLARNISLGLRLAANILSGHMLLNILSGFTFRIMRIGIIIFFSSFIPLGFILAFSGLEVGIALIQSQVFVVLTCSYLKNSVDLH